MVAVAALVAKNSGENLSGCIILSDSGFVIHVFNKL